jgi:hypothetical protein
MISAKKGQGYMSQHVRVKDGSQRVCFMSQIRQGLVVTGGRAIEKQSACMCVYCGV